MVGEVRSGADDNDDDDDDVGEVDGGGESGDAWKSLSQCDRSGQGALFHWV